MITDTLDGRIKLAYVNGFTDEQIAEQENIAISIVEAILSHSRLPIKITGIVIMELFKNEIWLPNLQRV